MKTLFLSFLINIFILQGSGQQLTTKQKQAFLDRHNYWRARTGAPAMRWSDTLAAAAKKYADFLAIKCDVLKHSNNDDYGENLYWGNRNDPNEIIDLFAAERGYYHGDKITERGARKYGHYTQLIWPRTTEVGCAFARCGNGFYYFCVCKYNPVGNIIGEKAVK
jgi:pathogenesis-related protein 1